MQAFADVTNGGYVGLWTVIYVVLLITLGVLSIRKGHWVMFIIGIFIPLFWFIGAVLPRKRRYRDYQYPQYPPGGYYR